MAETASIPPLPIIRYSSLWTLLLVIVFVGLMLAGGVWILVHEGIPELYDHRRGDPMLALGGGITFAALCMVYISGSVLIRRRPLVLINETGVGGLNGLQAAWNEIDSFQPAPNLMGFSSSSITVMLKDKMTYYAKLSAADISRAKSIDGMYGTPIVLDARSAKLNPTALLNWLNHYKAQYAPSVEGNAS